MPIAGSLHRGRSASRHLHSEIVGFQVLYKRRLLMEIGHTPNGNRVTIESEARVEVPVHTFSSTTNMAGSTGLQSHRGRLRSKLLMTP